MDTHIDNWNLNSPINAYENVDVRENQSNFNSHSNRNVYKYRTLIIIVIQNQVPSFFEMARTHRHKQKLPGDGHKRSI